MTDLLDLNVTYKVDLAGGQSRLREAILYVAHKGQPMVCFGGIKLNKILWRADFRAFAIRHQPVTGRQYQRLRLGPAPIEMLPVLRELRRDDLLKIEKRPVFGRIENRPVPLAEPILKYFSPNDLEYLDESLAHFWEMTGTETSDDSHGLAWRTRHNGALIPYEAAYLEDRPLPSLTLEKFADMGRKAGWHSN